MTTTHGPWRGLDFDPTTDFTRTAQLCPEGWLEVFWNTDDQERGPHLAIARVFGVERDRLIDDAFYDEMEAWRGFDPEDFGLGAWPHRRMFILRLEWDVGDDLSCSSELLRAPDGELAYADPLPAEAEVNSGAGEPPPCCGIAAVETIDRDALLEVLARGGPPDDETFKARVSTSGPRPARGSTADALALLSSIPGVVSAEIKEHALHLEVDEWTDPAEVRSVVIPHMPAGLPIEVSRRAGAR